MIPRIFHRIWLGTRPRPERYDHYWHLWKELHPDAEFITWTEQEVEALPLVNREVYDLSRDSARSAGVNMSHERAVAVQQADVVAYELIQQFGGVYLNCDMMPLRSLDDLFQESAFLGMEDSYHVCNAVMAAQKEHPLFDTTVAQLGERFRQYMHIGMEVATGPQYLTQIWRSTSTDVKVLPIEAFYPVHHSEIPYGTDTFDQFVAVGHEKNSYAVHMWGHRYQEGTLHS